MAMAFTVVKSNLCFLIIIVIINCFIPTIVGGSDAQDDDLDVPRLGSQSYFDGIRRIKQTVDYAKMKENGFSHRQSDLHKMLQNLGEVLNGGDPIQKFFLDFNDPSNGKFSAVQLLEDLRENGIVSELCANDTGRIIANISSAEPWVIQFLDAWGKPGPSITHGWLKFVGNYDQCRTALAPPVADGTSSEFEGEYCVMSLAVPQIPIPAEIGGCFPNSCSETDIVILVEQVIEQAGYSVKISQTQCLLGKTEITTATLIAIVILCLVIVFALIGTVYDLIYVQKMFSCCSSDVDLASEGFSHENYESIVSDEKSSLIPKAVRHNPGVKGTVVKIILAFSLYTNGKKVLNTSQNPGALNSINGIRFISMCWVVLGHVFLFATFSSVNIDAIQTYIHHWTFDVIANGFLSVDTFFTLSGLLIAYVTIDQMKDYGLRINWVKFYFHRIWRLTPPYMFSLVIMLGLQQYLGTGPLWYNEQPSDKSFCEKNWWTNFLYINNLVRPLEPCFAHCWYLANDMQFFVISPLMLIPFYYHWAAGVASCTTFLLASWITTGVLSTHYGWGTSAMELITPNHWFDKYYVAPWCRIGPYAVGIMAGYFLSITKGKSVRMQWWVVTIGWLMATGLALTLLYGINGDISGDHTSSIPVAALYNAVARSLWGACICWVIIACCTGYGGPVNAILSWSPFVVLGRLTYMTYLIHFNLIAVFVGNMGTAYYSNETNLTVVYLGVLTFVNMAAFVLMLLLESPMIGLERVFLKKKSKD